MSIKISGETCTGCGLCTQVCPGSLISVKDGKAAILRPERCWGCVSCVKECPAQAIGFYLGEDMGGLGGVMTVRREGRLLHWTVRKPDGTAETITVDGADANEY